MKVKSYQLFLEELDNISATASVDTATQLKTLNQQVSEYNSKKSQLDNFFKTITDENILSKRIDSLLGVDKNKRNPFLVEHLNTCMIQRKMNLIDKSITDSQNQINQLKITLNSTIDVNEKSKINEQINGMNNNIQIDKKTIEQLKKDLDNSKKSLLIMINNKKKELQNLLTEDELNELS